MLMVISIGIRKTGLTVGRIDLFVICEKNALLTLNEEKENISFLIMKRMKVKPNKCILVGIQGPSMSLNEVADAKILHSFIINTN